MCQAVLGDLRVTSLKCYRLLWSGSEGTWSLSESTECYGPLRDWRVEGLLLRDS